MGDWSGTGRPDQSPPHPVTLSAYYIAPYLVTVQQYCDFLNESTNVAVAGDFMLRRDGSEVLVNYPY
jgi:formylglycine-generating enzyme required for sulfatase activity